MASLVMGEVSEVVSMRYIEHVTYRISLYKIDSAFETEAE